MPQRAQLGHSQPTLFDVMRQHLIPVRMNGSPPVNLGRTATHLECGIWNVSFLLVFILLQTMEPSLKSFCSPTGPRTSHTGYSIQAWRKNSYNVY